MFVPDDAKKRRRLDKLTASEWYVYEAHCERRMAKTGLSDATNKEIAEREGIALKSVQNAMWRLGKLGWLRVEDGGVRPLVGDFSPVDKKHAKPSPIKEAEAEPVPCTGNLFPDMGNELPCTGKDIPHTGNGAYKGTRARPDQPLTSPTSTHTPAPASGPPATAAPPDGGGVCVSMPKSRFGREQCVEWAKARKAEGGRIDDPYAVGRMRWLDGTADDEIGEFLARRELVQEGKRPVEQRRMPYHVAAQMVNSVKQSGGDVGAFIANELPDVSAADRAKLLARFTGQSEQARAHAPP